MKFFLRLVIVGILAVFVLGRCNNPTATQQQDPVALKFTTALWQEQNKGAFVNRELLLNQVLYSDSLRQLKKPAVLAYLGPANRVENNHYYYTVSKKKLGFFTLHTRTLVIKFTDSLTVGWIKLHE